MGIVFPEAGLWEIERTYNPFSDCAPKWPGKIVIFGRAAEEPPIETDVTCGISSMDEGIEPSTTSPGPRSASTSCEGLSLTISSLGSDLIGNVKN